MNGASWWRVNANRSCLGKSLVVAHVQLGNGIGFGPFTTPIIPAGCLGMGVARQALHHRQIRDRIAKFIMP
jgi:hypothetical protein